MQSQIHICIAGKAFSIYVIFGNIPEEIEMEMLIVENDFVIFLISNFEYLSIYL